MNTNPDDPETWFSLSEADFLRKLEEVMALTGNPGDAFGPMVSYNVPWFLLRELWPQAFEELSRRPLWMAFAAAEEGWRGRLDNIRSRAASVSGGHHVEFAKTYVMTADRLLVLLAGTDGPCLALLAPSADWEWAQREEAGLHIASTRGREVRHYRVRGSAVVGSADLLAVPRRAYTRVGMLVPRREITGMAFLALGKLRHLGRGVPDELRAECDRVLEARAGGRLGGQEVMGSLRVLDAFFELTADAPLEPFWSVIRSFRDSVGASLRP